MPPKKRSAGGTRPVRSTRKTNRNVFFFRAYAGYDDEGEPRTYDLATALGAVRSLGFDTGDNYLEDEEGNATCCWVDRRELPFRARLATVRRVGLPQMEAVGVLKPLPIPEESGLAEETHVVFFPDSIVGTLFNFYGPRLTRLGAYLAIKCPPALGTVVFEPLLKQNVLWELDQLQHVRMLDLTLRRSAVQVLEQADTDLLSVFEAAATVSGAERVRIVLQSEPYSRHSLPSKVLRSIKRLARWPELREVADRFVVKGYNSNSKRALDIDVLTDQLVSRQQVVLHDGRTRALNAESAYEAIESAYAELHQELLRSAAVGNQ